MTRFKLFQTLLVAAVALILTACGSSVQEKAELNLTAEAEGPFFEGPNSLYAEYEVDMNELFADQSYTIEDIKKISLQSLSVSLNPEDSLSLEEFTSASVSIAGGEETMTAIAIMNPIEQSGTTLELTASDEADLAPFFKAGKFTIVVDWDFKSDDYSESLSSEVNLKLNTELKSN